MSKGLPEDDRLFEGLTDAQRAAVRHRDGPLLVLAAAGSGKTTVITRRIANLIATGVPPWSILALTFTNKAAGEMRERVDTVVGHARGLRGMTVSTFHSFCARLLRRYAEQAGLTASYSIYDMADQKAAMKEILKRLELSKENFPPDSVLSSISNAKNNLVSPEEFTSNAGHFFDRKIASCYTAYQKWLQQNNAVDFDDLLAHVARLLKHNDEVRDELQARYRYILIDEYQDTNHVQFVIAHTLAAAHRNICVVGDPDQSIYGWRGADISNILEFNEHYAEAQTIKLGENFRSTAPILETADYLIKHNKQRRDKPLYTTKPGGDPPIVYTCYDEHHESRTVVEFFRRLGMDEDLAWKDMAVLYRTNALSRVMEAHLRDNGIPYTIVRGTAFFDRKEIKDSLAYLRVMSNPHDEVPMRRIINTPPRGIGSTTLKKIDVFAAHHGIDFFTALQRCGEIEELNARAIGAIQRFLGLIDSWRDQGQFMGAELSSGLADLVARVVSESGLEISFRKNPSEENQQRLDNLAELVSAAREFEDQFTLLHQAGADPLALVGGISDIPLDDIEVDENGEEFDPFGGLPPEIDTPSSDAEPRTTSVPESTFPEPALNAKIQAYLEHVALIADADQADPEFGSVTLMTLHAAKGLEFPAVAIVGLDEGILPHSRARDNEEELEEERRLCFVGITRAKSNLLLTHAAFRTIRGLREPQVESQFLSQLPDEVVERQGVRTRGSSSYADGVDDDPYGDRAYGGGSSQTSPPKWAAASRQRAAISQQQEQRTTSDYPPGCRVLHPQFGTGRIQNVSRAGKHTRLRIEFDAVGTKTLIAGYARLEKLD